MGKLRWLSLMAFVMVFAAIQNLSAGGTQAVTPNATGGSQSQTIELRFSWWGGQARNDIYNQIADRFEADNPGIKIVREPISWNDYWTKIPTQVAAGAAPDIMQMHARYVRLFSDRNALLKLDDLVNKGAIDLSKFSSPAVRSGVVNGVNVMVSIGVTTTGIVYNSALLKKLGLDLPSDSWNWDQYEAFLVRIAKAGSGIYACSDDSLSLPTNTTPFTMFMRSRGKDFYTDQGKIGFAPQDLFDWLSMWDRLRKAGAIMDARLTAEEATKTFEQQAFVAGKQVFIFLPANRLRIYQDLMKDQPLHLLRAPATKGKGGEFFEGAHIAVNAKTKHPEAAAKFINYFVNTKRSLELYKAENGFPASSEMNEYVYTLLDPSNQEAAKFLSRIGEDSTISPYIVPPNNNVEIIRLLDSESQAVAFGAKSVQQAVDAFFKALDTL